MCSVLALQISQKLALLDILVREEASRRSSLQQSLWANWGWTLSPGCCPGSLMALGKCPCAFHWLGWPESVEGMGGVKRQGYAPHTFQTPGWAQSMEDARAAVAAPVLLGGVELCSPPWLSRLRKEQVKQAAIQFKLLWEKRDLFGGKCSYFLAEEPFVFRKKKITLTDWMLFFCAQKKDVFLSTNVMPVCGHSYSWNIWVIQHI